MRSLGLCNSPAAEGQEQLRTEAAKLPKGTRDLVAKFEAGIDQAVLDDLHYDYRVRLVPMVGTKTDADLAINFVNLDALSEDERITMLEAGRSGTVIIREKHVEVANKDMLRASQVAAQVDEQVPYEFNLHREHTQMWQRLAVRPVTGTPDPYATDPRYCVYDEAFGGYVYTRAWVKRIVKEAGTVEKYRNFFGREPLMKKVTALPSQTGPSNAPEAQPQNQTV